MVKSRAFCPCPVCPLATPLSWLTGILHRQSGYRWAIISSKTQDGPPKHGCANSCRHQGSSIQFWSKTSGGTNHTSEFLSWKPCTFPQEDDDGYSCPHCCCTYVGLSRSVPCTHASSMGGATTLLSRVLNGHVIFLVLLDQEAGKIREVQVQRELQSGLRLPLESGDGVFQPGDAPVAQGAMSSTGRWSPSCDFGDGALALMYIPIPPPHLREGRDRTPPISENCKFSARRPSAWSGHSFPPPVTRRSLLQPWDQKRKPSGAIHYLKWRLTCPCYLVYCPEKVKAPSNNYEVIKTKTF